MYSLPFLRPFFYVFILLAATVSVDTWCMGRWTRGFKTLFARVAKPSISKRRINIAASRKPLSIVAPYKPLSIVAPYKPLRIAAPHRPKPIISDLDGTIVNTESVWLKFIRKFFTKYKKKDKEVDFLENEINGLDVRGIYEYFKRKLGISEGSDCFAQTIHSGIGESYKKEGVKFIPGAESFFENQRREGRQLALVTNSPSELVAIINEQLKLKKIFDNHIYTRDNVDCGKPYPDIYLYAVEKLGVDPKLCIAVEDSPVGIKAAKSAGMFVIGLNLNGSNDKEFYKADLIVSSYEELNNWLYRAT